MPRCVKLLLICGSMILIVLLCKAQVPAQDGTRLYAYSFEDFTRRMTQFQLERKELESQIHTRLRELQGRPRGPDAIVSQDESFRRSRLGIEEEALIIAAGQMRVEKCTNLLLNRIMHLMRFDPQTGAELPHTGQVVKLARRSLLRIGNPAADAALQRLPYEEHLEVRQEMLCLIEDVKGTDTTTQWLETMRKHEVVSRSLIQIQRIDEAIKFVRSNEQCSERSLQAASYPLFTD